MHLALLIFIALFVIGMIILLLKLCIYLCDDQKKQNRRLSNDSSLGSAFNRTQYYNTDNNFVFSGDSQVLRDSEGHLYTETEVVHQVHHHADSGTASGLANDVGSTFANMFSASSGHHSGGGEHDFGGGGHDSGGGGHDSGGGRHDSGGGGHDSGGGFDSGGGDTGGGFDSGGGDASYD